MENIIAKITDKDFGLEEKRMHNPITRYASRGIVLNNNGEMAIFHKKNKNEYKLPGGGMIDGENPVDTFKREVLEETGCIISDIKELGITIEEKNKNNFYQISHIFEAKVSNNTYTLSLTNKEIDEGGELLWLLPQDAYEKISECIDDVQGSIYDDYYKTLFMVKRDMLVLQYFLLQKSKRK